MSKHGFSMQVLCLFFGMIISESNCLRFQSAGDAHTHVQELQKVGCQEQVAQGELGAIVGSVAKFFKQRNLVVYPSVLTMVAAMRYGGVSVEVNKQRHIADHDLDFMVLFPEETSMVGIEKTLTEWAAELQATSDVSHASADQFAQWFNTPAEIKKRLNIDFLAEYLDSPSMGRSVLGHYRVMDFALDKHTSLTDKWNNDGLISENRLFSKRFQHTMKQNVSMPEEMGNYLGAGSVDNSTHVSFWMPIHHTEDFMPSAQNKTLFMGHEFPFPKNVHTIFKMLMDEFGEFHPAASRATSLCDFMKPSGLFEEDLPETSEVLNFNEMCIQNLHRNGFASFQYCMDRPK